MNCMCTHLTDFKISSIPLPQALSVEELLSVSPEDILANPYALILTMGLVGAMILFVALSQLWMSSSRNRLMGRLMSRDLAFQPDNEVLEDDNGNKRFRLADFKDKMWLWSIETELYPVLMDDLATYAALDDKDKRGFEYFPTTLAALCATVGLPIGRVVVSIPESRCLDMHPEDGTSVDTVVWRNQVIGTSMVMAFLSTRNIVPRQLLDEQLEKQRAYFRGCHALGFNALVMRWKTMLHSNLHVKDWYPRGCIWRLVWLQRRDGLWDLTEDFAKAIGAHPDPLMLPLKGADNKPGVETIKEQIPTELERLFPEEPAVAVHLWCTLLAKVYLESEPETFLGFTGLELDEHNTGILITVIAERSILWFMDKAVAKAGMEADRVAQLKAKLEEDACLVVKSFRNLRTARLQATIRLELKQSEKGVCAQAVPPRVPSELWQLLPQLFPPPPSPPPPIPSPPACCPGGAEAGGTLTQCPAPDRRVLVKRRADNLRNPRRSCPPRTA